MHGDDRDANVMVAFAPSTAAGGGASGCQPGASSSSGSEFSIRFIDFDWAGQDGVDHYPLLMSTYIPWPEGVGDQLVMRQSHDFALLSTGGAGRRSSFYSWWRDY